MPPNRSSSSRSPMSRSKSQSNKSSRRSSRSKRSRSRSPRNYKYDYLPYTWIPKTEIKKIIQVFNSPDVYTRIPLNASFDKIQHIFKESKYTINHDGVIRFGKKPFKNLSDWENHFIKNHDFFDLSNLNL